MFAIISDATFHEQVFERFSARSYDVAVANSDGYTVVRLQWEAQSVELSTVERRLVGKRLAVAETKIWHPADRDGTREAEVEGEVSGAPVTLTGTTRIVPSGGSTIQQFDPQVSASTPEHRQAIRTRRRGRRSHQAGEEVRTRLVLALRFDLTALPTRPRRLTSAAGVVFGAA